jgi:hypothetical protein
MMIRAVRAVNTMAGLQTFNFAITCFGEDISSITDSFTQCGIVNHELAFIHYTNETKSRFVIAEYSQECIIAIMHSWYSILTMTFSLTPDLINQPYKVTKPNPDPW